jgi:hypothetical protein
VREQQRHLVEAAKPQAVDGRLLARRQRRVEAQRAWPLEHTQRHRDEHSIGCKHARVRVHAHLRRTRQGQGQQQATAASAGERRHQHTWPEDSWQRVQAATQLRSTHTTQRHAHPCLAVLHQPRGRLVENGYVLAQRLHQPQVAAWQEHV